MPNRKVLKISVLSGVFCLLLTSCFKDVDFDQAEDIKLTPDLEASLLFYTIDETDFMDSETNEFTPVIRDTVRLEFLDDDYIQDGLMEAEFRFKHVNRFPYLIRSSIRFLSENDRRQFSVNYEIPPGSVDSPSVIDTIHVVDDIRNVRRSIKMLVELEMIGGGKGLDGELDFSSKGLFKFEF